MGIFKAKSKLSVFFISLFFCSNLLAAEVLLIGNSQLQAAPDELKLDITIRAECYPTPADAAAAADNAAADIFTFLSKRLSKNNINKIFTTGGYTQPFTKYVNNRGQRTQVCEHTFQKQTHIGIISNQLDEFKKIFNDIQDKIYKHYTKGSAQKIDASTYAIMNAPIPYLSFAQSKLLENTATEMALSNAYQKLQTMLPKNNIKNARIINVSEIYPQTTKVHAQKQSVAYAMESVRARQVDVQAPVQFNQITVYKTLYVTFSLDDFQPK